MNGDFQPLRGDLVVADIVVLDVQEHGQPVGFPGLATSSHAVVPILYCGQFYNGIQCDLRHYSATVAEVSAHWLEADQAV